jgi:four helix bundle protein
MQNESNDLSNRLLEFGASAVNLAAKLNKTVAQRHVGLQLLRAATSSGANYEEACAAESRADFVHKMQIVLKELRESLYWLRLIEKSLPGMADELLTELKEARELTKIVAKSVITAKKPLR